MSRLGEMSRSEALLAGYGIGYWGSIVAVFGMAAVALWRLGRIIVRQEVRSGT